MIEIGRMVVKTAGRDARKQAVIVEIVEDNYVIIDGQTRRKKCNIKHLEPLDKKIDIQKGANHTTIITEFKKLGIEIKETKPKEKTQRPKKQKLKKKAKTELEKTPKKPVPKTKEKTSEPRAEKE